MDSVPGGAPGCRAILTAGLVLAAAILVLGAAPVRATTGGPDSYGYIWVDSRNPSPIVTYSWIDIVPLGTRLTLEDEDCTFEVNIGFQFRFYGTLSEHLYICSNGWVAFSVPGTFWSDPPLPSPSPPNNRIVALGPPVDLNPNATGGGGIYFFSDSSGTPRRFVVTWNGVFEYGTSSAQTFQLVLEQTTPTVDGRILLQYHTVRDLPPSPLVGIENRTGSSGLSYPGPLEDSLAVAFLPPTDAGLPPDQLRVTATTLAPDTVEQGTKDMPVVRLDFSALTNSVDVGGIHVVLSGPGAGPEDVTRARLWLDDGDGTFTPATDLPIAFGAFSGAPPIATLRPTPPLRATTVGAIRAFVTYDVASSAGIGDWIGARFSDPSSVSVVFPDAVSGSGFPIETYTPNVRTVIEESRDTLYLSEATSLVAGNASQWEADIPTLSLRFDADRNTVDLRGIRAVLGGDANTTDVWAVKAIRDRDGDHAFTPGTDEILGIASPAGSPPAASLTVNLTVAAGTEEDLLLLVDIAPDAVPGRLLNLTVNGSDLQLGGSRDTVSPLNFPANAGNQTIVNGTRPTLRLPWSDTVPEVDGVWRAGEYLLGPPNTATLDRPAGNLVPGYVSAQNNGTALFVVVDAVSDLDVEAGDGVALSFDTDLDGNPTAGADDVLVINATDASHYRYNASAGSWTPIASCTNGTAPACASGIGLTPLGPSPHRLYEAAIPLATLGLTPGDTVHVGVAGPLRGGLADGGNRSTWPLLFGTSMPSLAYFGGLVLAPGPTPNRAPVLNWTGDPGYTTDGVEPDNGTSASWFRWRILYVDEDSDPPSLDEPRLHVRNGGVDIPLSPFRMNPVTPKGADYRNGAHYFYDLQLPCGGAYSYFMSARDARGLPSNDTPLSSGPNVACPNGSPTLADGTVSPPLGTAGATVFAYQVTYADPEGEPPSSPPELFVLENGNEIVTFNTTFAGWVGGPDDYFAGAIFTGTHVFPGPGGAYAFRFRASDGTSVVDTDPILGPYVSPVPPNQLRVIGGDVAPFYVDEGVRGVPFLGLFLSSSGPINVTSIRFDLIGTASDADVALAYLYHDLDGNWALTNPDTLLGTLQPLGGTLTFPLPPLLVANATSLLVLLDIRSPGTPDATVGLEVVGPTSVTVGPGALIEGFSPQRSTRAIVNVAPSPADLTVDGYAAGSAGIHHLVEAAPLIGWRFADLNAFDVGQDAFNASVSAGAAVVWSRNETGNLDSIPYGGPPLSDGETYLLTVSVFDGRLWSTPVSILFRMNTPPPAPTLLAPADLEHDVDPSSVTLLWNPIQDGDSDTVTYSYWVSDNPGFSPVLSGTTLSPGIALPPLGAATTYYWKVGASDGFESSGNSTVWRFTTVGGTVPSLGEVRGWLVNGSDPPQPIVGALVLLVADEEIVAAQFSAANGSFYFQNLDLRMYEVRFLADGFVSTARTAHPTSDERIVDLGEIRLAMIPPANRGDPPLSTHEWPFQLIIAALGVALGLSLLAIPFARRRRGSTSDSGDPSPEPVGLSGSPVAAPPSPVAAPPGGVTYECPLCGRMVTAQASSCECGAVFET